MPPTDMVRREEGKHKRDSKEEEEGRLMRLICYLTYSPLTLQPLLDRDDKKTNSPEIPRHQSMEIPGRTPSGYVGNAITIHQVVQLEGLEIKVGDEIENKAITRLIC